ncbi:hypothetical protein LCGC14_1395530 [marine sediment metagenome]|uniref:Uncharacterized protein n=1 Tax=marine sediment metagenome TaxID=412755 RepID=A0A0F9N076_9ZZZZ
MTQEEINKKKLTKEYYKKLAEDYRQLLLRSMKLNRDVLADSKKFFIISMLFHVGYFIIGFLIGLTIVGATS